MRFFRERIRLFAVAAFFVLALIVLNWTGGLSVVQNVLATAIQPLQGFAYSSVNVVVPLYSTDEVTLISENTSLKEQLADLAKRNNELQVQLEQYEEYKEQIEFVNSNEYASIPAVITSRVGHNVTTNTITINRGERDGLKVGYPVIYGSGILIGIVYEVESAQSDVALITSSLVKIQGEAQANADTTGLVTGQFGTSLQMDLILKDRPLVEQELIVTNGQDKNIPAGLIIGAVQNITDESSELFKQATITPVLPFDTSSVVSVVVPN